MSKFELPEAIKLRRVPRAGYFGLVSYAKSVTTLGCEISSKGSYKTGLTPEQEAHYEAALDLKKGELSKHSKWWTEVFNVQHPIRLHNTKATELILDSDINQIKYFVLLASSKVANSEIEKNPNTIFYIDNAEAKAKAEVEQFNYEFEGAGLIHKMSPEDKRSNLRLFGKTGLDEMSETVLNAQLMGELKKNPKAFVDTLQDKDVATKALIKELVEKNILKRKGNYYMHGDDTIANSTEECVDYLNAKTNQSVRLILVSRLNKAKKAVA
jgi:hypothetical protein